MAIDEWSANEDADMLNKIDRNAVAAFVIDNADCSELYEDDAFVVAVNDQRFYVERKRSEFVLHFGEERIRLPRC